MRHVVILVTLLLGASDVFASPNWRWEDRFSSREKNKLQQWVLHAEQGIATLFGPLPYTYRVHFHRMTRGRGPAPWAHTDKRRGRAVHFHVNTSYDMDVFRKDWTAPHELSHLMFPYLGRSGTWFSEGLASYLQYQIMYANGTITWQQAMNKLRERFRAARRQDTYADMSIVDLGNVMRETRAFVRIYWGGGAYFLNVDHQLARDRDTRLNDVIKSFLACCIHQQHDSSEDMMRLFDRLSDSSIFSRLYQQTVTQDGFPHTSDALEWLNANPPALLE